jgi:hypothetical protein
VASWFSWEPAGRINSADRLAISLFRLKNPTGTFSQPSSPFYLNLYLPFPITTNMPLDHFSFAIPPSQFDSIVAWYEAALAPIGYSKQIVFPGRAVGFGPDKVHADFWLGSKEGASATGLHFAFKVKEHELVEKFHEAAIKAGGVCNGKPGLRTMYHPEYYGAYVLDPLG